MTQLVHLPIKTISPIKFSEEFSSRTTIVNKKFPVQLEFIGHQPEQKSWEFLSQYINNSQFRHEQMKSKISEANILAKKLEAAESYEREAKLKKEELEKLSSKEIEEKKALENNNYERPQSKALAESFLDSTKEIFSMSTFFENFEDATSKAFRLKLKMTINRRTCQITDSIKQIRAVAVELVQICFESRSVSKQAFAYCLVLLSNKLLAQAESQVSLHPPSAFPLALVAVEISTNVVEFPSVLMSALIKKCCFAVPKYPKKSADIKKELGYLVVDGIVKETDNAFFERMSGLISFYSAIVQTNSLSGKPNVLGLNLAWTWLATILNLPPRSITPYLLASFLEQASFALYKKYGVNFEKLVKFILEKYVSLIPSSSIAARTRLEILCKEFVQTGFRVKEPPGMRLAP